MNKCLSHRQNVSLYLETVMHFPGWIQETMEKGISCNSAVRPTFILHSWKPFEIFYILWISTDSKRQEIGWHVGNAWALTLKRCGLESQLSHPPTYLPISNYLSIYLSG